MVTSRTVDTYHNIGGRLSPRTPTCDKLILTRLGCSSARFELNARYHMRVISVARVTCTIIFKAGRRITKTDTRGPARGSCTSVWVLHRPPLLGGQASLGQPYVTGASRSVIARVLQRTPTTEATAHRVRVCQGTLGPCWPSWGKSFGAGRISLLEKQTLTL